MIRMVYISSAVRLMTDAELVSLLRQCRANNEKAGITGMLLYKGGNFMQALEGPEEDVDRLQRRIETDPRHTGIITLSRARWSSVASPAGPWASGTSTRSTTRTGTLSVPSCGSRSPRRRSAGSRIRR